MNKINEMNDWAEYQEKLKSDMDRQVTSNKALLWVGITVNGIFTLVALVVAVVALVHAMMLGRDNLALQKEILECKTSLKSSIQTVEEEALKARRAYDSARQRDSRRNRSL